MFIFTFLSTFLILSRGKIRRGSDGYSASGNDGDQFLSVLQEADQFPNDDITYWIRQLQIEHCVFVEIGEGFCALFVGIHDSPFMTKIVDRPCVAELFLGLWSYTSLYFWNLCSIELTKFRKSDCTFIEEMVYANTSAQAYQRLCNISLLNIKVPICSCSVAITNWQLHRTEEFSTCFQSSLPKSLCNPCNVYGITKHSARTINEIHYVKRASNCHQKQPFCEGVKLWTSMLPVVASSRFQQSSLVYNNTFRDGLIMVAASCYNQVTEKKAVGGIGPVLFCTGCIQKGTRVYALKEELNDNSQEIDEVYNDNDYKEEILLVIPKNVKSRRLLSRRLLQSIGHEYYGNMDYNVQGDKFNYKGYARYVGPVKRDDEDEGNEDYEVTNEKGDNPEEEEEENENENDDDEDDDEFGHESLGQRIRMARSNVLPYMGKKQKKYLTKENIRIRSVTEECNEEPTEELQYYDYETSGVDALFGSIHKLQNGYLKRLTISFTLIILM